VILLGVFVSSLYVPIPISIFLAILTLLLLLLVLLLLVLRTLFYLEGRGLQ